MARASDALPSARKEGLPSSALLFFGTPERHWCRSAPHHLPVVIYTRPLRHLFRRRYWLCCWECELRVGPFSRPRLAWAARPHPT